MKKTVWAQAALAHGPAPDSARCGQREALAPIVRRWIVAGLTALAANAIGPFALAQNFDEQLAACNNSAGAATDRVNGCTVVIQSGRVAGRTLALAYQKRGDAYLADRDTTHAIADYDEAVRLNPSNPSTFFNRGIANDHQQNYAQAIADYDQALLLRPGQPDVFMNRGNARDALRDFTGAIADFDDALRINPNYGDAYYNRGRVRARAGDYESAIVDFGRALQINPEYASTHFLRALAELKTARWQDAWADCDAAIRLDVTTMAQAYYCRGVASKRLGHDSEGQADIDRARASSPDVTEVFSNLGIAP